jgi:protein-S-isoprenylcysteine O-methyltransferase Ste14
LPEFSILDLVAWVALLLVWGLWAYGFVLQSKRKRADDHAVTAPAAKWGIALQVVAFFLASLRTAAATPPRLVAGLILGLSCAAVARQAVKHLGKQWRIQAGLYADHELVRTGPYRFVRHPIYARRRGGHFS